MTIEPLPTLFGLLVGFLVGLTRVALAPAPLLSGSLRALRRNPRSM